jgi:hypothetical protein
LRRKSSARIGSLVLDDRVRGEERKTSEFPTKVLVTVNGSDEAKLAARVAADPTGTFGSSTSEPPG